MSARKISLSDYQANPEIPNEVLTSILNYQMPHKPNLEEAILGAMLLDAGAYNVVKRLLKTKKVFYLEKHQTVFDAIQNIKTKGGMNSKVDLLTVTNEIEKMGLLTRPGLENTLKGRKLDRYQKFQIASSEIVQLTNKVASAANIEHHSRILYELYMRRKALVDATSYIQQAQDMTFDVFDLYEKMNQESRVINPSSMLVLKTMNEVMDEGEKAAPSQWVIGNLVKENEVVILYGDEGTGKSVLAFQMCDMASKGKDLFPHADFKNQCDPKLTIFYDFELEESELYSRYSINKEKYNFHENFRRSSINKDFLEFDNADELIINEIQRDIETIKPQFVVIDNITYIASESQDPTMATKLMKKLLALQKRYRPISIIVIAHTPKRDMSMPIESRHLSGAKNLANFAKSLIAVSHSKKDPDKRYIKHVKCRNGRKMHGEDNVIECVIAKEGAKLGYEFYGFSTEQQHLEIKDISEIEGDIMDTIVRERKRGTSFRKITVSLEMEFGISWSHTTIQRKLKVWNDTSNISGVELDTAPDPVAGVETRERVG